MIGIISIATGECVCVVYDGSGYDPALYNQVAAPDDPINWQWSVSQQLFVARQPSPAEITNAALESDPRWQAIKTATPDQIETWLTNNVTNLAEARTVLKFMVLAIQRLAKTRSQVPEPVP